MSRFVGALALLALVLPTRVDGAERPVNVLFLFADDMRPDCIAALGHPVVKTPHLDALVERGFVFHNAYCMGSTVGAVCNPSRHMTFSGMSLYHYDPKRKEGTWGDVMRKAGYLTYHESKRGNTARVYHTAFEHSSYLNDRGERTSGHHGRTAADNAIGFLREKWDRERPLFMYVGFTGPHDPRVAAKEWMDLYDRASIPLPPSYAPFHAIDNNWMTGRDESLAPWPRTPDVVREHLHDYYGCISSIDHHVGRLLKTFADLGELDRTVVVFSADHGLAVGSHGLFGKQNLYEHSMRSPLVLAGPGVPQGETRALAYLFDVYPTACALADVDVPDSLEGRSQLPVMRGEKGSVRDVVYLAFQKGQRAVRKGDWKLYRFPLVDRDLLFNLKADPLESRDLSRSEPAKLAEMRSLMVEQHEAWDDPEPLEVEEPGKAEISLEFFERAGSRKKKSRKPNRSKNSG